MKTTILTYLLAFILGICTYQMFKFISSEPAVEVKPLIKPEVTFQKIDLSIEKKNCKEKGGEFRIYPSFKYDDYDGYSVECTKYYKEGNKDITETIFEYVI